MRVTEITPKQFSCQAGGCPAIFKTDRGTYLIIGTKLDSAASQLSHRIGPNEVVIEVPIELMCRIIIK